MENPLISVIIPVYNEEKYIAECIKTLFDQSYKNIELIIVDDGSTDRTKEIVKGYPVKLIEQKHSGPGAARNSGARKSSGEILVFADADMKFDKKYIEELVMPIIKGEAIGSIHYGERCANLDNIIAKFQGIPSENISSSDYDVFRAIRKDKFTEVNGFNTERDFYDDKSLYEKIGISPIRVSSAICYHRNAETLKELFFQLRWRYTSYLKENGLTSKFVSLLIISTVCMLILLLFLVTNLNIGISVLIIIYVISGFAGAIRFRDLRALIYYPLYLFTMVLSAVAAFIRYQFSSGEGK